MRLLNASSPTPVDRRADRTQLFLVATLSFGRASVPVRVRNLSATGALVEGADVPPLGTVIVLRRGSHEAAGTVAWSGGGKAGLSFGEPVAVSLWLPHQDNKHQTEIDRLTFAAKQPPRPAVASIVPVVAGPHAAIVAELAAVRAQIDQIGHQLGSDTALLARHPEVRLLALAAQRLNAAVEALRATDLAAKPA